MNSRPAANGTVPLLTPAEVAAAFRVDPKTVTRWAKCGKLSYIRTLGGHRRFLATEVTKSFSTSLTASGQIRSCRGMLAPFVTSNGTTRPRRRRQAVAEMLANYVAQRLHYLSDHGKYQLSAPARGPSGRQ
jgi:excisionase family DNA binding protein